MKVGVYTISLNEAKFAARWAETVAEADCALVADTGSTDNTVDILERHRIPVHRITVRPWRFDDARNTALALMPDDLDVLISLDMDETLACDWRRHLASTWQGNRLRYGYVWSWLGQQPNVTFLSDKIAGRFTHRWRHPVHEILVSTVPEVSCVCPDVLIEHHADPEKSRSGYLDLLKLALAEAPDDDRCCHYLGREYFFHRDYGAAIETFKRHLTLSRATWAAERASSMRYIGKCFDGMGDIRSAHEWFIRAILEDSSRESLIEAAKFLLGQNAFYATIDLCERALALPDTIDSYMTERYANHEGPYDLAAVAYYHIGQRQKAIAFATEAVRCNPDDQRLLDNLRMMGG